MIEFSGRRYYLDKRTGYYKTDARRDDRAYLHQDVWRMHHGNIPQGWHVHHGEKGRDCNEIDNLSCMPMREHVHRVHKPTGFVICEECGSQTTRKSHTQRWCSKECSLTWHNRNRVYVGHGQYVRPKTKRSTNRLA